MTVLLVTSLDSNPWAAPVASASVLPPLDMGTVAPSLAFSGLNLNTGTYIVEAYASALTVLHAKWQTLFAAP